MCDNITTTRSTQAAAASDHNITGHSVPFFHPDSHRVLESFDPLKAAQFLQDQE